MLSFLEIAECKQAKMLARSEIYTCKKVESLVCAPSTPVPRAIARCSNPSFLLPSARSLRFRVKPIFCRVLHAEVCRAAFTCWRCLSACCVDSVNCNDVPSRAKSRV